MSVEKKNVSPQLRSEIEFGLNMLRQQNLSKSIVFSPMSISFGLALVHAAASGTTRDEIRDALLRGSSDEQLEEHLSSLYSDVMSIEKGSATEVNIANHVFCLKDYPIKKSYLDNIGKLYQSGASSLDFSDKVKSADVINKFVAEKTNGHITNVISPEAIEEDLVAVFTNALYFKALWHDKFPYSNTRKAEFFSSADTKRSVDFLIHFSYTAFSENDQFEMLRLPYEDQSFAMNIFLPKTRFGLKETLMKLTPAMVENLLAKASKEFVNIKIPKWKIVSTIGLNEALKTIGITRAFDIYNKEFRKLADDMLGLSEVAHSAMIEVDEDGTTAAACTILRLRGGGCPERIVRFTADHPFLFMLTKDTHPIFIGLHY